MLNADTLNRVLNTARCPPLAAVVASYSCLADYCGRKLLAVGDKCPRLITKQLHSDEE
jgi:hypothetical protein